MSLSKLKETELFQRQKIGRILRIVKKTPIIVDWADDPQSRYGRVEHDVTE